MEKPRNQQSESPARTIINYRWIVVLVIIPLFYTASNIMVSMEEFLKLLTGLVFYNFAVTLFMMKVYPKTKKIPDYIYYIDTVVIPLMSLIFGGLSSDVYVIYLFIIALYCASNKIVTTMRFTGVVMGLYTGTYIIHALIYKMDLLRGENLMRLLMRDVSLLLITYAIGLLVEEVRKAGDMHRKEFQRARTDRLTGLPNRHFMESSLVEELADCNANGKVLNVLMFDIDNFKRFNDTYGHSWGDELLKRFATILGQSIRKADIPIRYGGEEFIVLVKDIDFTTAKGVANRVRRQLELEKIIIDNGEEQKRVTVSCGVAQYPTHSSNIKEVIEMADKALYGAKGHGKNVVIGYDEFLQFNNQDILELEKDIHMSTK